MFCHLGQQTTHIGPFDPDAINQFRHTIRAKKVDLCLSRTGDMNMGRFMIECVDHKPEAMGAVYDNSYAI